MKLTALLVIMGLVLPLVAGLSVLPQTYAEFAFVVFWIYFLSGAIGWCGHKLWLRAKTRRGRKARKNKQ